MWAIAVWTPAFTSFLHQYLIDIEANKLRNDTDKLIPARSELPIGDVIQAAIYNGMRVEAEVFPQGSYLDIGTPDDLVRAVANFATQASTQE
jgi:glucose-1-phosphate thymidylyltransferase